MKREYSLYAGLGALLAVGLLALVLLGPRLLRTPPVATTTTEAPGAVAAAADVRKIRAQLFYVSEDGVTLTGVEQEVVYGEGPVEQAKRLVEAQLATPAPPLVSAVPQGTKLRAIFVTNTGDAYLDLSGELRANHPGGTTNEILAVYSLVNALTANLPAVTNVQILIDGKEVDTLGGHLDLRRPIAQDTRWITQP
jgi:spore germination protein GerM